MGKVRWKILFTVMAILMAINIFTMGCQYDKSTGEFRIRVNPNTYKNIEDTGTAGLDILAILTPFLGPVGGIATGTLATGLALLKKFKPQLTEFKTKAELSHIVASISVETLEELKIRHPEAWADLEGDVRKLCEESGLDTKIVKNAIRGLRGLPAKV